MLYDEGPFENLEQRTHFVCVGHSHDAIGTPCPKCEPATPRDLLQTLRALLVRERRWQLEDNDEDRAENVAAFDWAIRRLSEFPWNLRSCGCVIIGDGKANSVKLTFENSEGYEAMMKLIEGSES